MLNWIAVIIFTVLTATAGGRLLLLWRRTRQLPELLIAVLILGVGTFAVGLGFILRSTLAPGPVAELAAFIPVLGSNVGMAALCAFTWIVYRRESRVAGTAAWLATGLLAGLFAYAVFQGSARVMSATAVSLLSSSVYVGVMGWSACEALLYWSAMRRRMRLGLADPLVTNRVLLWGIATGTAGVGIFIGAAARHLSGTEQGPAWVTFSYAAHGLVSAIAFWLSFNPPEAYARWVTGSAEPGEAATDA